MKTSSKYWLFALALVVAGATIGAAWVAVCLTVSGYLVMNGAWLLCLVLFAGAIAAILAARREELVEEDAMEFEALVEAVDSGAMTINEARAVRGLGPLDAEV